MDERMVVSVMTLWGFYVVAWFLTTVAMFSHRGFSEHRGRVIAWAVVSIITVVAPIISAVVGFGIMLLTGKPIM